MTDIESIVKIDADVYARLFDNGIQDNEIATDDVFEMARALRLGKSLLKGKMIDYQKYINALRKCAKEHENDRTFTGHISVTDLCRDTANLLESLEQEPEVQGSGEVRNDMEELDFIAPKRIVGKMISVYVLDKIRTEIEMEKLEDSPNLCIKAYNDAIDRILQILDKYRAESEDKK